MDGFPNGSLGEVLRRGRAGRRMSQEQLAEAAGISVRTVRNLETGKVRPRGDTWRLLARALGIEEPRNGPAQLPADIAAFTGRDRELSTLDRLTAGGGVTVVCGTAGVGKTALAVRWGRRSRARFPDGQLYVDLRGYGPDRPLEPVDVLGRFLRALGVDPAAVPEELDERAARFRSELDGRRVLVVLDNAGDVAQVRPLLPGAETCCTVVTSRSELAGLVARDGARRIRLPRMPDGEAADLVRSLVDGPRVDDETEAVRVLIDRSCGLPLALRLVAELAVARPDDTLARLVAELEGEQLDRLGADDDPLTALRAVFSWSVRQLGEPAARAFRLLGLHPGARFGLPVAAALVDGDAGPVLGDLVRAHLVERDGDRFAMHDLLRAYALELVRPDERASATTRMLESYVDGSAAAADLLFPADREQRPRARGQADVEDPRGWFERERENLVEAAALAARDGHVRHADAFSRTLWRFLFTNNHYTDAMRVHGAARDAGRSAGRPDVEATGLHNLGTVQWRLGRYDEALGTYEQALVLRRGDAEAESQTLNNIGIVHMTTGRLVEAQECFEPVLAFRRGGGDVMGTGRVLANLATVHQRLGRVDEGLRCCEEVWELFRDSGDRWSEASALNNLGLAYQRWGRYAEAAEHSARAFEIYVEIGDRGGQAIALGSLAVARSRAGRPAEALEPARRAVELQQEIGDTGREVEHVNAVGEVLAALGRFDEAVVERCRALELARAVGNRFEESEAQGALAELAERRDRPDEAAVHWRAALDLYEELNLPAADHARAKLR